MTKMAVAKLAGPVMVAAPAMVAQPTHDEQIVFFATDRNKVLDKAGQQDAYKAFGEKQQNDLEYGSVTVNIPRKIEVTKGKLEVRQVRGWPAKCIAESQDRKGI